MNKRSELKKKFLNFVSIYKTSTLKRTQTPKDQRRVREVYKREI